MTGYLQRLVARRAVSPAPEPAPRPTIRSASPIAEADQRMNSEMFADQLAAMALDLAAPEPAALGESRTVPSYKLASPAVAPPTALAAAPAIRRFVAPQPAAPSAAPPLAATPLPTGRSDDASSARSAPIQPRVIEIPTPVAPQPLPPPLAFRETAPPSAPHAAADIAPAPSPSAVPPDSRPPPPVVATTQPVRPAAPSPEQQPAPTEAVRAPPARAAAPVPEAPPAPALQPSPRRGESEIALNGAEPLHAPEPPRQHVIVREVLRTPAPTPQPPPPAPQRGPRTAEEASLIGPLARPERMRARLDLWLR